MPTGNLLKPNKAKFISLVGMPANETSIRIIRSATAAKGESAMATTAPVRRVRRNAQAANNVLQVAFPTTMDDAEVADTLKAYGLGDYKVSRKEGEGVVAVRSDLQSIAKSDSTMDIKLTADGIVATIQRSADLMPVEGMNSVSLVGLTFSGDAFADTDSVNAWLTRNSVDNASAPAQNPDQSFVVTRGAMDEKAETRQVQIDDGVVATIVRSDCCDVPDGMVAAVCEAAYGGWGWGQLDFAAAMADVEFCEWMDKAMSRLSDVLRHILFWSQMPLDVRKELVFNALSQFGAFVSAVMEQMPRQLIVSVVRSAQPKEIPMSTTQTQASGTATTATATPAATTQVQRSDAPAATASAIDPNTPITTFGALKDAMRSAQKELADEAAAQAAAEKAAEDAKANTITRADLAAAVAEHIKPLTEQVEALKGTTVVRSDTGDNAATTTVVPAKAGETKDVFRGAFGKLPVGSRK